MEIYDISLTGDRMTEICVDLEGEVDRQRVLHAY